MGHVNGVKRSIQYLEHEVQRVCKNWASDPSRGLVYCNGERHYKPQPTEVEGSSQRRQGKQSLSGKKKGWILNMICLSLYGAQNKGKKKREVGTTSIKGLVRSWHNTHTKSNNNWTDVYITHSQGILQKGKHFEIENFHGCIFFGTAHFLLHTAQTLHSCKQNIHRLNIITTVSNLMLPSWCGPFTWWSPQAWCTHSTHVTSPTPCMIDKTMFTPIKASPQVLASG